MNRKLKFKVWDYFNNSFVEGLDQNNVGEISISLQGDLIQSYSDDVYRMDENRYKILQFTGYLDKNNVEIYEGDYVKVNEDHATVFLTSVSRYTHGEVTYISGGFNVCQYYLGRTPFEEFVACDCCPCGLEVIGNKFETEEIINLIDKEKREVFQNNNPGS